MQSFHHKKPIKSDYQPHQHIPPNYGARQNYREPEYETPNLNKSGKLFVQQVTGIFPCYTKSVDITMLVTLSAIASEEENTTTHNNEESEKVPKLCSFTPIHDSHVPCK